MSTLPRTRNSAWRSWYDMRLRCTDPKHRSFKHYGLRGITVCERWQSFDNFLADMGARPDGLTLERKNNSLGYSKENCVWASYKEQANNQRNCAYLTYEGHTATVTQWAEALGVKRSRLYARIACCWPVERVLFDEGKKERRF